LDNTLSGVRPNRRTIVGVGRQLVSHGAIRNCFRFCRIVPVANP
jgi:hypothetical protein